MRAFKTTAFILATWLPGTLIPMAIAAPFAVGQTVPASTAFTDALTGKTHTLAEFRGHPVVLEWTNPGCPFTQKFYRSGTMQALQKGAVAKGVTWITVNSAAKGHEGYTDPASARTELPKQGYNSSFVVLDTTGTLGHAFEAETTPDMFVLDKDGQLVYSGAIDSIPSFDAADIAKAKNYVTAALDDLAAGKSVQTPQTNSYGCSVKY